MDEEDDLDTDALYTDLLPGPSHAADGPSYDDLTERNQALEEENKKLRDKCSAQAAMWHAVRGGQLKKLADQNEILARNISCLFKTAQMEVQRKDRTIAELRAQLGSKT